MARAIAARSASAQVGAGDEEAVELAADRGLGAVAELANQGGGVAAVRRGCRADGRITFDDRPGSPGGSRWTEASFSSRTAEGSRTGAGP